MLGGLSRNVKLITLDWVLTSMGFSATAPFMAIYLAKARAIPFYIVGVVFLVQGILGLLSQIIGGFVADSVGPRRTILGGNLLAAASTMALAYMVAVQMEPLYILGTYLAISFLRGLPQPASSALVADEGGDIITKFSLITMAANFGFALGPAVAGFLVGYAGYAALFVLSAALSFAAFVFALPLKEATYYGTEVKEASKPDASTALYLAFTFIGFLAIGQDFQPFALYASVFRGQTDATVGLLFSFSGLLIVALQLSVARVIRRHGPFVPAVTSLLVAAAGYFATAYSRDTSSLFACMAMITLAEVLFVVPTQVWITYRSPGTRKGAYQGYYLAVRYTGYSVAAWLGTTALGAFSVSPAYAWYVVVAISLVSAFLFFLHRRVYGDIPSSSLSAVGDSVGD